LYFVAAILQIHTLLTGAMSLFGDEDFVPSAAASKSRLSLFDDEPSPAPGSKSSLFADDDSAPGSSPWGLPTPKKASRGDLIKNLLPASDVPDSYVDTFDAIIKAGDGLGGKITAAGATKILSAAKVGADEQSRIVSIVSSGGQLPDLSRNEFNVFLALIGLAQEHEDITLDSVDERRRSQCFFHTETR
jgi:sorting nexin-8